MSFGGGNDYNRGINNLGGISQQATNQLFPQALQGGQQMLRSGTGTLGSGLNFFRSMMGGNQADTQATLQPDIDRMRNAQNQTLQATSTLMPRGGGRSAALFNLPFQTNQGIQGLFGQGRPQAAQTLAQAGMEQLGMAPSWFNTGANALGIGNDASRSIAQLGLQQKQMSNNLWGGLGKTALGLGLAPFTGGLSLGMLGMGGKN